MRVISSIIAGHNLWLVCLAAVVCIAGSTVTVRLLERAMRTEGLQRSGWLFQAASAGGSSVWCTHFVAILAYQPGTPVTFDPILTVASLAIAILGLVLAFAIAAATRGALTAVASGTLAGLTISLMHYVGMAAYHVSGIVASNGAYVAASVVLSVVLSVTALTAIMQTERAHAAPIAMFAFVLAILSQHFTGMAAISVIPLASAATNAAVFEAMAVATAGVALFIVGTGVASQMIDSRARSENNRRLHHMALNDPLTGLPNRTSFSERLDRELARAEKEGHELAVIGIDLNRFKEINDFRGHSAGDQALKIIAGRLTECVEGGEFVARIGGDEFAALKDFRDEDVLLDFLGKLEVALFEPLEIDDFRASAGASIGVAVYPHDGITAETLIGNSDLAMYRAKSELNTAVCFYESRLDEIARERQALARELRRALELQQFDLHFQVQISVTHATICGYEVLLRWYHPERGLIPPLDFIPIAEESGAILDIGEWVLREACRRAAGWQIPHRIAVNLSPVQFGQPELPRLVHEILMETGLPAARLELEITESTIIADKPRALHILRQIKALGVTVALDDFGTGYSSLDTLRSFPFDKIKLDRLFMNEVETNPQTRAIVRAVLALGKSLDVPILAEGVETDNQLELLRREGCDEAQGFLLGRPGPHEEILQYDDVFTLFETELMAKTAERA
ncbi:putative bifunctional diguanylate cyclase/phosphodiesterase [Bradyrhizobium sp.]|uniref:putative bifunctional diguanylate cyclase/phosphodiesterase n=1 Tax=Bradyrhizobium sp. TaxID=376 RepID=UPI002C233FDB|nr:EAL domain-containing protein [Bradyrhizobium sp.]HWX60633.1 EAL domain-containing protein [Bradyrhizobium sp.]